MSWDSFIWFALGAVLLWTAGAFFAWKEKKALVYLCTLTGIAVFFAFILGMWISLERPPLRTMGETRLWYSFFLPVAGIIQRPPLGLAGKSRQLQFLDIGVAECGGDDGHHYA